jgi:hypothetical protein
MIGKLMANLIIHLSTWILLKIIANHTKSDVDEFYRTRARKPQQRCSPVSARSQSPGLALSVGD